MLPAYGSCFLARHFLHSSTLQVQVLGCIEKETSAMPRRVVLYPRVSVTEQQIEPQIHGLTVYVETRGLEVV